MGEKEKVKSPVKFHKPLLHGGSGGFSQSGFMASMLRIVKDASNYFTQPHQVSKYRASKGSRYYFKRAEKRRRMNRIARASRKGRYLT